MRKVPNRPRKDISQTFNDGVVKICTVTDTASPGRLPVEKLTQRVKLHYEERKMGITRYYTALQNQVQVERVIRVPKAVPISNQDVAITEDGTIYAIEMVQMVEGVYPPCLDLTLKRTTQKYEVSK